MADNRGSWWEKAYAADTQPWSISRPQRAVVKLVDAGAVSGRTLDVGCGVGTHACYLASEGYETVGVDIASRAVEQAERRAAERGIDVEFRVGDALALGASLGSFETVLDVGVFHAFDAIDRQRYAESLFGVVEPGGHVHLLEFGPDAHNDGGPNPIGSKEIRDAFADGWTIGDVRDATFETREGDIPGVLATAERTSGR